MKLVHASVLLLLTVAAAPAAVADGGDGCLVALADSAAAGDFPKGLRAVAPTGKDQRARVLFACRADRISGMTIRLVPGQVAEARLILVGAPEHTAALISDDGLPSDWVRMDSSRLDVESRIVTLTIAVPDSAATGRVFSDYLRLGPARANLDIPVTLEIIDEEPLFRDEFDDVDPSIGQFSMVM